MRYINKVNMLIRNREYEELIYKIKKQFLKMKMTKNEKAYYEEISLENWGQALILGRKIAESESVDNEFYKSLALVYLKNNLSDKATLSMKKSLNLTTGRKTNVFLEWVNQNVLGSYSVDSQYVYSGGAHNLGLIMHYNNKSEKNNFITKIIPANPMNNYLVERELFFAEKVRFNNSKLEKFTPELISYCITNNQSLHLLTFEKKQEKPNDRIDIKNILKLNNSVANAISYIEGTQINKKIKKRKVNLPPTAMHKKETHELIIKRMYETLIPLHKTCELRKAIDIIKLSIKETGIYKYIEPQKDYVFCHGDFHNENIVYDKETHKYILIDWTNYGFGLRGYDLANYFSKKNYGFKDIEKKYIDMIFPEKQGKYELEKIFFVYELLNRWIASLTNNNLIGQLENNIYPAAKYLEILTQEYLRNLKK